MKFSEILKQAIELLQESGRITYRTLKREFELDDEALDDLKFELIEGQELAVDKDGKTLIWIGADSEPGAGKQDVAKPENRTEPTSGSSAQAPVAYTPAHLAERIRAEQEALENRGGIDGERKTITALFADLKGSTALLDGLDPEVARSVVDPVLQLMMDAVHRYEGYVAQALGDGILALFGAPIAHEDHAQRSALAALKMQADLHHYSDQVRLKHGAPLAMRVGLNTGEVVVRSIRKDDLHTDYVPVGHSINLAARMEQMADPGSILATQHTAKLIEGYFTLKPLGAADIKGLDQPLPVFEVAGPGALHTRLQVAARRGLTRFVGRRHELETMERALDEAREGRGQVIGIMGEPGMGKSRLMHEFKASVRGFGILQTYATSHGKATPYLPITELLKEYFQFQLQDDERTRREKVIGKLLGMDRGLEQTLPYYFALLNIEEADSPLRQMDPQLRRQRTFEALKKVTLSASLEEPLVLIFEDLHWIDSETQGFLDGLVESLGSSRILLLTNFRPEYRHDWGNKTYCTQLRLAPFGRAEADEFLRILLGAPADTTTASRLTVLQKSILEKTEGTPFFMEEMVEDLFEQKRIQRNADGRLTVTSEAVMSIQLPTTVQGVLAARIDRLLPEEKSLLQQLSVIGREFPLGLAKAVVGISEDKLLRQLAALQKKEFLYEQPAFPEVEYIFKHALTQDVAYNSLLQETRKTIHEQTAIAIENLYQHELVDHYQALAHHYGYSTNAEKAIEYLTLAGYQVVERSTYDAAIQLFSAAIDRIRTLPASPERSGRELELQVALGVPLQVTKGWASDEVDAAYKRARQLCDEVGDSPQVFPTLYGLWVSNAVAGKHSAASELCDQLLRLAKEQQDNALLLIAHNAMAPTLTILGDFRASRVHAERAYALYNAEQHHSLAFSYGSYDPGMAALVYLAETLACLGYTDQGLKKAFDAVTLARELRHPFSEACAHCYILRILQWRQDPAAVAERAETAIELCSEHGYTYWMAVAKLYRGWALTVLGRTSEGGDAISDWRASGARLWWSNSLALSAEAQRATGRVEDALATLDEAFEFVQQSDERFYEAELYRLRGELLVQQSEANADEAIASVQRALEIARAQQAKLWELRAAMSLARLWRDRNRSKEACDVLALVYDSFTEDLDAPVLVDAKSLLDGLTGSEK